MTASESATYVALNWKAAGVLLAAFLAWSGALFAAIKWLLDRYQKHLDERFKNLEKTISEESQKADEIEKYLLRLERDLPKEYVRKEDAIRSETVLHAKVDSIGEKLERWRLEMTNAGS